MFKRIKGIIILAALVYSSLMISPSMSLSAIVPDSQYSLTAIIGSYAWGQRDHNDVSGLGYVDNVADRATVESLMSDGYTEVSPPLFNGIYNWEPDGLHALEFAFNSGTNYSLNSLSFTSSRNYDNNTPISIEYAVDGSGWIVAASTTSGTLGIITGPVNTYTINLGGVIADRIRFVTNGGEQVSLHEIIIDGEKQGVLAVPTMTNWGIIIYMILTGIGVVYYLRRKNRAEI